jgi:hypothetical protein
MACDMVCPISIWKNPKISTHFTSEKKRNCNKIEKAEPRKSHKEANGKAIRFRESDRQNKSVKHQDWFVLKTFGRSS